MNRVLKAILYPLLPSLSPGLHAKRRKGLLYRCFEADVLECQVEQDRIFWSHFLTNTQEKIYLEVGGDGVVGSHTIGLETIRGWSGAIWVNGTELRRRAESVRKCQILSDLENYTASSQIDLLAIHSPAEFLRQLTQIGEGFFRARWVVVENREPDPQWCRLLTNFGYKLRFYFHDDEYYELQA